MKQLSGILMRQMSHVVVDLGDTGARLVWAGIGFRERLCLLVLSQIRIWANITRTWPEHTGAS